MLVGPAGPVDAVVVIYPGPPHSVTVWYWLPDSPGRFQFVDSLRFHCLKVGGRVLDEVGCNNRADLSIVGVALAADVFPHPRLGGQLFVGRPDATGRTVNHSVPALVGLDAAEGGSVHRHYSHVDTHFTEVVLNDGNVINVGTTVRDNNCCLETIGVACLFQEVLCLVDVIAEQIRDGAL